MRRYLVSLLTALAVAALGLVAMAPSAQAACTSTYSRVSVKVAVPLTIDGTYDVYTYFRDCGSYGYLDAVKFIKTSGPQSYPYDTSIRYYGAARLVVSRSGTFSLGVKYSLYGRRCNTGCSGIYQGKAQVTGWPDGTFTGSDIIT